MNDVGCGDQIYRDLCGILRVLHVQVKCSASFDLAKLFLRFFFLAALTMLEWVSVCDRYILLITEILGAFTWKVQCSGMLCPVFWCNFTVVSEERTASTLGLKSDSSEQITGLQEVQSSDASVNFHQDARRHTVEHSILRDTLYSNPDQDRVCFLLFSFSGYLQSQR
jgi:hypothetical protein